MFTITTLLFRLHSVMVLLCAIPLLMNAQTQKGFDIDGSKRLCHTGIAVSMPDVNTVAVLTEGTGTSPIYNGDVRVYEWNGSLWIQKGKSFLSSDLGDFSECSISMPDANTIAIGKPYEQKIGDDPPYSGHVQVYQWTDSMWVRRGKELLGEASFDRFGSAVSMPDNNTLAVGAYLNGGAASAAGHVRIYQWNENEWIRKGNDIDGGKENEWSGFSIDMPDANTIGIGSTRSHRPSCNFGSTRIYVWNGMNWIQRGATIESVDEDAFGHSVSMPNPDNIAIGAKYGRTADKPGSGYVRAYKWNGDAWRQRGVDIYGDADGALTGTSIAMPNESTLVIGAPNAWEFVQSHNFLGRVYIYQYDGDGWVKQSTIFGEEKGDCTGYSVSMPNATTVAIGAPTNSAIADHAGSVRVFTLDDVLSAPAENTFNLSPYPNPFTGHQTIDLGREYYNITLVVSDLLGTKLAVYHSQNTQSIAYSLDAAPGTYFVTIKCDDHIRRVMVNKNR